MGFWSTLGDIGKFVTDPKNIATGAGFAVGGPAGAAAGRALGGAVPWMGRESSLADDPLQSVAGDALGGYAVGAAGEGAGQLFASEGGAAATATAPAVAGEVARTQSMQSVRDMGGAPTPTAQLMASAPDSGMEALSSDASSVLPRPGMTSLEKAFLISQIASTAGSIYGGFQANRQHNQQSRAGGDIFGRMLRDNMRYGY